MTDESHGDTPNEAPVPPTSTRWSEDTVPDDHAPVPPFVPGRDRPAAAAPAAEPDAEEAVVGETEAGEPEPFPFEAPFDAEEEEAAAAAPGTPTEIEPVEDDFPFERFDIEGRDEGAGAEDPPEAAPTAAPEVGVAGSPAPPKPAAPAAEDAVEDVAAVLERLAGTLRSGGEAAVRRELDSPDRLTAVLAGILAGYLSGRS